MSRTDAPRFSGRPPKVRSAFAFALATMLALTGASVGQVLTAPPAAAAAPFSDQLLYGAGRSSATHFFSIDPDTLQVVDVLPQPNDNGDTQQNYPFNQLAISSDGRYLIATTGGNGGGGTNNPRIWSYDTSTETWSSVARESPLLDNNMGGFDPVSGLYFYGGATTAGGTFSYNAYDPATNELIQNVLDVTLPDHPGKDGDLAFDRQGNMYVTTSAAGSRGQLYRVDGPMPAGSGPAERTGAPLGPPMDGVGSVTSMAFGPDGYMYLATGPNSGDPLVIQVDPRTGAIIESGVTDPRRNFLDMASNAFPSTVLVNVDLPGGRAKDGDQFGITISGSGMPESSGETTGDEDGLQDQESGEQIGRLIGLPGDTYTIEQTLIGDTAAEDYRTTWQCVARPDGTVVASGDGNTGSFTMPGGGNPADVDCTFTNVLRPAASDDESLNNSQGSAVTVPTLDNDRGDLDPSTVNITGPDGPTKELVVDGEGTWTVNDDGSITFTPEAGFTGNPTPIDDTVEDTAGEQVGATVTVTYLPEATDDESLNNQPGSTVTVPTLDNDRGDLDPSTVNITGPDGPTKELVVDGEGTWTVNDDGSITFTPEAGFEGNPTPIDYTVSDRDGNETGAKVTITYLERLAADDDRSDGNTIGGPVRVPVLGNDSDNADPSTVNITGPDGPTKELVVDGEGTWTVNDDGSITFTPEDGFTGNPTPIDYTVEDGNGQQAGAAVTVTYRPEASNDRSDGNSIGDAVTVPVLDNDKGDLDPSTVNITGPDGPTKELVVDGEGIWTVNDDGSITFTPEDGFEGNPTPVDYTVEDTEGNETGATVTVTYLPEAADDRSDRNSIGDAVTVPVLDNDKGDLDPSTVRITDPNGDPVDTLEVPGEGTWTVDPDTGDITFTPEEGFEGNPTPIDYTVEDPEGNETGATVTVTYLPEARDDRSDGNTIGDAVMVPVLDNDNGDLDPSTVRVTGPLGNPVEELTVPGEGTWRVDPVTGGITFTPEDGFTGNPTPIDYTVEDTEGNQTGAKVIVTYLPQATDDRSDGNTIGDTVTIPVLDNDKGDLDPSTVRITDSNGAPVRELAVPGEGTWTVDPETGDITFTPEEGFTGNPTPIDYTVEDTEGNQTGAKVIVTYLPQATDDESRNNPQGATVAVPTLDNDKGDLDPSTVRIIDPNGDPVSQLVVPGEGAWSIDPESGDITFTPEEGFTGNPKPVDYTVKDRAGNETGAMVTIAYLPTATDDRSDHNTIGQPVTVPVLGNDGGDLDPGTVRIIDPVTGEPVDTLVVPGEGAWTVDPDTGDITFTPEDGFTGNPTPVDYTVKDRAGNETGATVTVTYDPQAADDRSDGNRPGTTVTVPVLDNDGGDLDPGSVRIIDPVTGEPVDTLVVPGEGTWTVDPDTGDITFTPEPGFTGNPTPISYIVEDTNGNETGATVTITYTNDDDPNPTPNPTPSPTPSPTPNPTPEPTQPPTPGPTPPGSLPTTGMGPTVGTAAVLGSLLVVLGGIFAWASRRKKNQLM